MARKLRRFNEPGHAHELTFSCYKGLPLLSRDRTRGWLIEAVADAKARERFDLWAYVIMPEHVHLLIRPRESDYQVSRILRRIKSPVGRQAIRYLRDWAPAFLAEKLTVDGGDGALESRFWQAGGGYDRNVNEPTTVFKMIDYIHFNPVRRGLVERPEEWTWSSCRWYSGLRPVPLEMDATLPRIDVI